MPGTVQIAVLETKSVLMPLYSNRGRGHRTNKTSPGLITAIEEEVTEVEGVGGYFR